MDPSSDVELPSDVEEDPLPDPDEGDPEMPEVTDEDPELPGESLSDISLPDADGEDADLLPVHEVPAAPLAVPSPKVGRGRG